MRLIFSDRGDIGSVSGFGMSSIGRMDLVGLACFRAFPKTGILLPGSHTWNTQSISILSNCAIILSGLLAAKSAWAFLKTSPQVPEFAATKVTGPGSVSLAAVSSIESTAAKETGPGSVTLAAVSCSLEGLTCEFSTKERFVLVYDRYDIGKYNPFPMLYIFSTASEITLTSYIVFIPFE